MINEISVLCLTLLSLNLNNADIICRNSDLIETKSIEHKIDPIDFVSILWVESRFKTDLISKSGSCGIAQINPKYTDYYNKNNKNKKKELLRTCNILIDEKINITIAIEKYAYWYHQYAKRNKDISFCAYNYGFRCKGEKNKTIPLNVIKYVDKIKSSSRRIRRRYKILKLKNKSA